jgi:hypothetical protein
MNFSPDVFSIGIYFFNWHEKVKFQLGSHLVFQKLFFKLVFTLKPS